MTLILVYFLTYEQKSLKYNLMRAISIRSMIQGDINMFKKVIKKQENAFDCFVCGVENNSGLKTDFYELEDDSVVGLAIAQSFHQSYPHTVHGGVSTALLDETIGRAIKPFEPDTWGVTLEMTTKFKKPVPYGEQIIITGRVTENAEKVYFGEGEIILANGDVAVTASGVFYKMAASRLEDAGAERSMMQLYTLETDPTEIDVPEMAVVSHV